MQFPHSNDNDLFPSFTPFPGSSRNSQGLDSNFVPPNSDRLTYQFELISEITLSDTEIQDALTSDKRITSVQSICGGRGTVVFRSKEDVQGYMLIGGLEFMIS